MANNLESFDSLDAFRASEREALAPYANANGTMGATARALKVSAAFNDWAMGEARRGLSISDLRHAAAFLIASLMHDIAVNVATERHLKLQLEASFLLQLTAEQLATIIAADDSIPLWPVPVVRVTPEEEVRS